MPFENSGIMKDGKIYTEKVEPKYIEPTKLGEVLEEDADKKYYVIGNLDKWEYLKGPKKIERTSKTGFKYMFSEGGMLFPDALDKPARTMLTSESSVNRSSHIIRTSAVKKDKELIKDIELLQNKWKEIQEKYNQKISQNNGDSLVYESENIVDKMIIDLVREKIENIVTNNKAEYDKLIIEKNKMEELSNTKISLENKDVLDIYDIKKQIEKICNRKIWLKCGGFITIDKTEALTAIDVNTGKYTGNKNLEQTLYKVNEEATVEIAKQIRLRDIGGIIIIDYIDMRKQENKDKIQKLLEERLKLDRAKTQVEGFTKLDLMEMTRKHICSHKDRKENN